MSIIKLIGENMNKKLIKIRSEKEYWLSALNTLLELEDANHTQHFINSYINCLAGEIAKMVRELSEGMYTLDEVKGLCKAAYEEGFTNGKWNEQSKDGDWWIENYLPETSKDGKEQLQPEKTKVEDEVVDGDEMTEEETLKWIRDNYSTVNLNLNREEMRDNNDNNPATDQSNRLDLTEENNTGWESDNPTGLFWTDDKVIKFTQFILETYKQKNNPTGWFFELRNYLKDWKMEMKINEWMDKVGYNYELFLNKDKELTMTSGELMELINLIQSK